MRHLVIPPVGPSAKFSFQTLNSNEMKKIYGSIPLIFDLWNEFDYNELTLSMRQKNSNFFFEFLNRIRIGMPTFDDIKLLESLKIQIKNPKRKIQEAARFYYDIMKNKKTMIALFAKNEHVDEFYKEMGSLCAIKIIEVKAEDTFTNYKQQKAMGNCDRKHETKTS